MPTQVQSFALTGGLNVADEQMKLKPGELVDCLNVEVNAFGGYARAGGYERTDGRPELPSLTTYRMLGITLGGPRALVYGDQLVGVTSSATATVCGAASITDGDWSTTTAEGTVGIALVTGAFVAGEVVTTGGIYAFVVQSADADAALDDTNRSDYKRGAANAQRALIAAVPGTGPVRSVFTLKGALYAIRDKADNSGGGIYRADGAGAWVLQAMNPLLPFGTGGVVISEGMTVNGQTSGATGYVERVAFTGGDWNSSTATGYLSLSGITGTFVSGENIRVGVTTHAVSTGVTTVPTLPVGGAYEVALWNFYGSFDTERAYIVNGVSKAFEFSEDCYVPITTGMTDDQPEHIAIHKNYLFLSFKGSVQNSGAAEPHAFTVRLGANEIGAGDYVTSLYSIRQDVLAIATKNTIQLLYGSGATDWQLKKMTSSMGAFARCVIDVPGSSVVLDTNGMQTIASAQAFGDFESASLSRKVNKVLRAAATEPLGLVCVRTKSQIRCYYPDGTALFATYAGDKIAGWTKLAYPTEFACLWNGEDADGAEVTLAGGTDGYVYLLDSGNSYDGETIDSLIRLPFHHYGSPERRKRWRKIVVESNARDQIPLQYAVEYDYGDWQYLSFTPSFDPANGGIYDRDAFNDFVYDGGFLTKIVGHVDGVSANLSVLLYCSDDVSDPWNVEALHIHFSPLGLMR